jgi:hypothetical protein
MIFDLEGRAANAHRLSGPGRSLPVMLIENACGLIRNAEDSSELRFTTPADAPIAASLQTARARNGEIFIAISLSSRSGTLPDDFCERFRLTPAESSVLFDLAEGLNNAQIAEALNCDSPNPRWSDSIKDASRIPATSRSAGARGDVSSLLAAHAFICQSA